MYMKKYELSAEDKIGTVERGISVRIKN